MVQIHGLGALARLALLSLFIPLGLGCSSKSIKEAILPKASVMGVTLVELTPQQMTLKVDVKTDDVELMLGMLKVKYKVTILDSELGQQNENVPTTELLNLRDSGFAFLIHIPLDKPKTEPAKLGYVLQGAVVFKVIAKIADVKFTHQGEIPLNP
jgi:hypothetical protein